MVSVDIGEIVRPHGVCGELRVRLYNPDSEVLYGRDAITLRRKDAPATQVRLATVRPSSDGFVLITIDGCRDRNKAETFRGAVIAVPRDALSPTDDGEFYVCDIIGARASLPDGTDIGEVVDFRSYPTTDVVVIKGDKTFEVPLIDDFVASIDVPSKKIVLHSVEGLEAL